VIDTEGLQHAWPTEPAGPPPVGRRPLAFLKELPVLVVIAFALALLMKTFLLQMFYIPSASMEPTLHGCTGCSGDRVAVNKLAYRFREPRRGEIIVFVAHEDQRERTFLQRVGDFLTEGLGVTQPAEEDFIKRVIGLPGETVRVTSRKVVVRKRDGTRLRLDERAYILLDGDNLRTFGPFKVPADSYFVMGDNRNNSSDSRSSLGPIPRERIIGKAFVKIWPPSRMGTLDAPDYTAPGRGTADEGAPPADQGLPHRPAAPLAVPILIAGAAAGPWRVRRRPVRR
jgi:signal peptidase I